MFSKYILHFTSIGLDNGLATIQRQAIIQNQWWPNKLMHIYDSLCRDELKQNTQTQTIWNFKSQFIIKK